MSRSALFAAVALAALAVLPFVSSYLRDDASVRCATDGVAPGQVLRIRAQTTSGAAEFCSVRCAEAWIAANPGSLVALTLTAEDTRADVSPADAWFVRSTVVTSRTTGERIHVFADRAAALAHVSAYGGRLLEGADRPFRTKEDG